MKSLKKRKIESKSTHKAIFLNDTRRDIGHIGCNEVVNNIAHLCNVNDIEIIKYFMSDNLSENRSYNRLLTHCDCLIVNGEGSLHDDNTRTINILSAIKVAKLNGLYVVLLNALWLNNRVGQSFLRYIDFVACRDEKSYEEVSKYHDNVHLTLDFSLYRRGFMGDLNDARDIIFTDSSNSPNNIKLKSLSKRSGKSFYCMNYNKFFIFSNKYYRYFRNKFIFIHDLFPSNIISKYLLDRLVFMMPRILSLKDIRGCDFLISGRFHGIMLAVKFKKPFLYLPASNDKIDFFLNQVGLEKNLLRLSNSDLYSEESFKRKVEAASGYFFNKGFDILSQQVDKNEEVINSIFKDIKLALDDKVSRY